MKKLTPPWIPAKYTERDVYAIQALAKGEATPDQQAHALRFIVEGVCATYDNSYQPDSDRDTCFAEGKRHVGNQIVKFTKININKLKEPKA